MDGRYGFQSVWKGSFWSLVCKNCLESVVKGSPSLSNQIQVSSAQSPDQIRNFIKFKAIYDSQNSITTRKRFSNKSWGVEISSLSTLSIKILIRDPFSIQNIHSITRVKLLQIKTPRHNNRKEDGKKGKRKEFKHAKCSLFGIRKV